MTKFDIYVGDGGAHGKALEELPAQPVLASERGRYLAAPELAEAVNIALTVGQPLLVTGEPGCGKTRLAWSVASELGLGEPLQFSTRSASRAQDLLYRYDAVRRFQDIQSGGKDAKLALPYLSWEALGQAICGSARRVVLIDEIDKAPRDFPNDLLHELDRMRFRVPELDADEFRGLDAARFPGRDLATLEFTSQQRPIVIVTSNSERQLPLPFLRRCVYHHIAFPDFETLVAIIEQRLGGGLELDPELVKIAVARFQELRKLDGMSKRPATSELLAWIQVLHAQGKKVGDLGARGTSLAKLPAWQLLLKDARDRELVRAT